MVPADSRTPAPGELPGDHEPGQRSGEGAESLWDHLARDAQRKTASVRTGTSPGMRASQLEYRKSFTVLVVDDSEAARYAIARTLRVEGFRTAEAAFGADALKQAEFVSAVVLDLHLPDLHGLEVCRLLRARPRTATLPVITISAVDIEERHRQAAQAAGADDFVVAPVDGARLATRLDDLLSDGRLVHRTPQAP